MTNDNSLPHVEPDLETGEPEKPRVLQQERESFQFSSSRRSNVSHASSTTSKRRGRKCCDKFRRFVRRRGCLPKCACLSLTFLLLYACVIFTLMATRFQGAECELPDGYGMYNTTNSTIARNPRERLNSSTCVVDDLPISSFRLLGTHNSYHLPPTFVFPGWNLLIGAFQYAHPPLVQQLNTGVRHLELDVHFGNQDKVLNYHVQLHDASTSCYCLTECLGQVEEWRQQNPQHEPIFILFNVKVKSIFDDVHSGSVTGLHLEWMDKYLHAFWGQSDGTLFTPAQFQGSSASLQDAVASYGWPSMRDMRGKVVVGLMDMCEEYINIDPEGGLSERRAMFPIVPFDSDFARDNADHLAMYKVDSPFGNVDVISNLVERGMIVRVRANTVNKQDFERVRLAMQSRAQLLSFDVNPKTTWDVVANNTEGVQSMACGAVTHTFDTTCDCGVGP